MRIELPATAVLHDVASGQRYSQAQIKQHMNLWQELLLGYGAQRIALAANSSAEWALLDLACLDADVLLVPLPTYLSESQLAHVMSQLEPDFFISDQEQHAAEFTLVEQVGDLLLYKRELRSAGAVIPATCQKITFTSGSTGQPKGVCLSAQSQLDVAHSLLERINQDAPKHLCLLPLSTLLENIAGIYAPLLAGGEVLIAPDSLRGFSGSQLTNPQALLTLISSTAPKSLILVPELLQLLVMARAQGWQAPTSLEFIAVGGAHVSAALLQQAAQLGLPVYQGYGLSECASVVALSAVDARQSTAAELELVGLPLAHRNVEIIAGEIVVKQPFLGYLGDAASQTDKVFTGDLGELDAQGRLRILGRRKNLLISSLGRNISPEWPEALLTQSGLIRQALLLGDTQPYCAALLYLADSRAAAQLPAYLQHVNQQLPDYAQIKAYLLLDQPFSQADGTLTANGRPRRAEIAKKYQHQIHDLFVSNAVTGESYEFLSKAR
jgi:long-subunit acyl-CoA synthetase (AMP-forming)